MVERKISAGSYDLNKWLYGGYEKDIITTIYGPAGTGKTNLCILAATSQAKKGNKVVFIDTEGGFSIDRLKQMTGGSNETTEEVLKNIMLLKPTNFEEQTKAFSKILSAIKGKENIGLIIIDGISMLYRLEIAKVSHDYEKVKAINSQLARQLRILSEIARKRLIPIIITNQVYSDFLSKQDVINGKEKQVHMVGGDILKYWSKCIIELQNNRGKRKAILKKHRSLPEKELSFIITNSGIRRKGWI